MDSVTRWLAAAARHPLLTAEEEINLGNRVQRGFAEDATPRERKQAERAKKRMIEGNLRLIGALIPKYKARATTAKGFGLDDLLQEGVLGLTRAVEKFEPSRGYKFSTYAYWWIRQSMGRAVCVHGSTIKRPTSHEQITNRWRYRPDGQTLEEFAEEWGYKYEWVKNELDTYFRSKTCSLDSKARGDDNEESSSLGDLIPCSNSEQDLDELDYVAAVEELRNTPEIKDAMALIELSQTATKQDMASLMECSRGKVSAKLTDMRAQVREHAAEWIRETVCAPEPEITDAITSEQQHSVPKPVPIKVLVAAGDHEPQAESMTDDCSISGQQHEELERLVADVQETAKVEQKEAPKEEPKRRTRKPRAAAVATEDLKLVVGGKHEVHGNAQAIAALLKELG